MLVLSCCSWEPYSYHKVNEPGLSCCVTREKGPATSVTLSGSLELPADFRHTREPGQGRQRTAWLSPARDADSCSRPEKSVRCSRQGKMDLLSSSDCSAPNLSRHPILGVSGSPFSLTDCGQSWSPHTVSPENDNVWPRHPRAPALVHCLSGVHGQPLTLFSISLVFPRAT